MAEMDRVPQVGQRRGEYNRTIFLWWWWSGGRGGGGGGYFLDNAYSVTAGQSISYAVGGGGGGGWCWRKWHSRPKRCYPSDVGGYSNQAQHPRQFKQFRR